jgi:hypothetical protein
VKDEDRTMKLSLIFAASLATFALVGCGTSDEPAPNNQPPATEEPSAPETPSAPGRQLIEGKQLPTSPVNLIADPGFGLAGQQGGYGSFLAFYEGGYDQFELETTIDSRSPAGFGGAVGLVRPAGATDKKSEPVILLTSFLGGAGPFHAQIWVSKSDVKGKPVDLPTDGSAIKISVADGDPDVGESYDLKPVEGANRSIGGRTWVLHKADITKPLTSGGFFMIRTGEKGGHIHLAAPEVATDQLVVGQAVMRSSTTFAAAGRVKTNAERIAIKKYRAVPPRLTPAAPKVRIGQ